MASGTQLHAEGSVVMCPDGRSARPLTSLQELCPQLLPRPLPLRDAASASQLQAVVPSCGCSLPGPRFPSAASPLHGCVL